MTMQHLLLLHGAIGSESQLQPLADELKHNYHVHLLNFTGHGGSLLTAEPFSIAAFAEQVNKYLDDQQLNNINIFGYSMGGYVAMFLARNHPGKIAKIITLATKYHWDDTVAAHEVKFLDPEKIETKLPSFAEDLRNRHLPADWKLILHKTKDMLLAMGRQNPLELHDYSHINIPCLLLLGDKDKMITAAETRAVQKQLPAGTFEIIPDTTHPIEQVNIRSLASRITGFIR